METRRKKRRRVSALWGSYPLLHSGPLPLSLSLAVPWPLDSLLFPSNKVRPGKKARRRARLCETSRSPPPPPLGNVVFPCAVTSLSLFFCACVYFSLSLSLFFHSIQRRFFRERTNERRLGNLGGTSRDAAPAERGWEGGRLRSTVRAGLYN